MPQPIVLPYRGPQQAMGGLNQFIYALMMSQLNRKQEMERQKQAYEERRKLMGEERTFELQREGRMQIDPRTNRPLPSGGITEPVTGTSWGPVPEKAPQWEQLSPMKLGENTIYPQRNRETGEIKYFTGRPGASVKQNVDITIGEKQPLTPAQKSETQKEYKEAVSDIQNVKTTISQYKRDYLTWWGKGKHKVLRTLDLADVSLSKENKEFLQGRKVFVQSTERDFNIYRHRITGAQAAIEELDRLKEAMYNQDLSPLEFEAAANAYLKERERSERLLRKFLREGIDVSTEAGGKLYDRQFLEGRDDTVQDRQRELRQKGWNDTEVINQLQKEGYLKGPGLPTETVPSHKTNKEDIIKMHRKYGLPIPPGLE